MKTLIIVFLLFSSAICAAQSSMSEREVLMKSFEEVLRPGSLRSIKQAFGGSYSRFLEPDRKLNPDVTPDKWNEITRDYETEVEKVFSKPPGFTSLIAKEIALDLSTEELRQVVMFLSSDAGRKYSAAGERLMKVFTSAQGRAVLSLSMLEMYSAKVGLLGNKYGLKVAPLELQGAK